ncbi:hypothetical protein Pst134EA_009926 [Puccinia striiformis f. sp. tritici]|uniref:hypothetical protein n=1 Tax=Puccinia striiformis f. sp. tritici TaxID=168172 RepID=UPI0020077EEF|nr:hypothetical protein Pst134EA_009926 [Puccinia striiformis f. sp. tritici]KAH9469412.1 hypothetical protein Pst134EA_009926 [Puccinia striiformis f. sp. tritici]
MVVSNPTNNDEPQHHPSVDPNQLCVLKPYSSSARKRALVDIALIAAGFLSIGVRFSGFSPLDRRKLDDPLFGAVQNKSNLKFQSPASESSESLVDPGQNFGSTYTHVIDIICDLRGYDILILCMAFCSNLVPDLLAPKNLDYVINQREVDQLLKKYETTFSVDREGNPVYRYDTNHVASNALIEDDSLCAVMTCDQSESDPKSFSKPSPNGYAFFRCFRRLFWLANLEAASRAAPPAVNRELHSGFRSEPEYVTAYLAKQLGHELILTKK